MALIGIVRIQAQRRLTVIPHLTAETLFVNPTPMIAPVTVCVVETGILSCSVMKSVIAPAVFGALFLENQRNAGGANGIDLNIVRANADKNRIHGAGANLANQSGGLGAGVIGTENSHREAAVANDIHFCLVSGNAAGFGPVEFVAGIP